MSFHRAKPAARPTFLWQACDWGLFGTARASAWSCPRVPYKVKHCGHQTALRPYHIEGNPVAAHCFRSLAEAQAAAEAIATERGELIVCADLPAPAPRDPRQGALL